MILKGTIKTKDRKAFAFEFEGTPADIEGLEENMVLIRKAFRHLVE